MKKEKSQLTDRIPIPPEIVEAGKDTAFALLRSHMEDDVRVRQMTDEELTELVSAAFLAMLKAWPGWEGSWTEDATGLRRTIILPLSSTAFDELTELDIDEARKAAGAPAADDPEWKVVESAFPPTAKTEDGA